MRDEPIMVCSVCGTGFLVNPGSKIHPTPIWFTSFSESEGACLGQIRMTYRSTQIRHLAEQEKLIYGQDTSDR